MIIFIYWFKSFEYALHKQITYKTLTSETLIKLQVKVV